MLFKETRPQGRFRNLEFFIRPTYGENLAAPNSETKLIIFSFVNIARIITALLCRVLLNESMKWATRETFTTDR